MLGLSYQKDFIVQEKDLASSMESGNMDVLSTPSLCAYMENCAFLGIQEKLELNFTTVGFILEIKHKIPSKLGAHIYVKSTVIDVSEKKVTFEICAYEKDKIIAIAKHVRVIVAKDEFIKKLTSN